jgi:hypothetical protein
MFASSSGNRSNGIRALEFAPKIRNRIDLFLVISQEDNTRVPTSQFVNLEFHLL